jgi:hypothetical protein
VPARFAPARADTGRATFLAAFAAVFRAVAFEAVLAPRFALVRACFAFFCGAFLAVATRFALLAAFFAFFDAFAFLAMTEPFRIR